MTPWFDYPQYTWAEQHAIVIGAGIAGCQMTWHLSQRGWRVTLLEEAPDISSKASGNLAGVITPKMTATPSDTEQFYRDSFEYTTHQLNILNQLNDQSNIDWSPCGVLQLAHHSREVERWESLKNRHLPSEFIQLINSEQASSLAGITCEHPASFFPKGGFVNPASFCHGLLEDSHYQLITSTKVTNIQQVPGKSCWAVSNDREQLTTAPVVILCNGIDLSSFSQSHFIPQAGVLGQTTLVDTHELGRVNCVIGHEGYLTPTYQGVNVFGATFDRKYEDVSISSEADQRNVKQVRTYLPSLSEKLDTITSGHAAIRATTPDRYPYTGGLPDLEYYGKHYQDLKHGRSQQVFPHGKYQEGLFALGGFGARGLTTSAYCANALSLLINNDINANQQALLKQLHLARFLIRDLKRGKHS